MVNRLNDLKWRKNGEKMYVWSQWVRPLIYVMIDYVMLSRLPFKPWRYLPIGCVFSLYPSPSYGCLFQSPSAWPPFPRPMDRLKLSHLQSEIFFDCPLYRLSRNWYCIVHWSFSLCGFLLVYLLIDWRLKYSITLSSPTSHVCALIKSQIAQRLMSVPSMYRYLLTRWSVKVADLDILSTKLWLW